LNARYFCGVPVSSDLKHICVSYGVATVSRIDEIIGLFCRISSLLQALLQKRPIILLILLTVATLIHVFSTDVYSVPIEVKKNAHLRWHVCLKALCPRLSCKCGPQVYMCTVHVHVCGIRIYTTCIEVQKNAHSMSIFQRAMSSAVLLVRTSGMHVYSTYM